MSRWLPVPPPDRWEHDPQRLRALLAEYELSGSQAGALIGVDGRTMRRWTAIAEDVQRSEMPAFRQKWLNAVSVHCMSDPAKVVDWS